MPRYKRTRDEAELDLPGEPEIPAKHRETLTKLRNMWEFASLMQYIFLFGSVVRIDDDFDIEDLEAECLTPTPSERLAAIGLSFLKYVSSHRGLTLEIFDEYTRRQYLAKAPALNPFGEEEEPIKFNEMDIYTRIRILHQLSTWTLWNTDRIRGLMPADEDHLNWRMEPIGWDSEENAYYVLDDNRLYCRADEPLPPPTPPRAKATAKPKAKAKSKAKPYRSTRNTKATRSSKRLKVEEEDDELEDEVEDMEVDEREDEGDETAITNGDYTELSQDEPGYGFTSKTWSCIAVTLEDYQNFLSTIFRSRDANEKQLRKHLEEEVMPIIEKRAESIRQKQLKKLRELENLQKMATAKRSGRLANKAEREKEERERQEAEDKRQRDLKMAREEEERQRRIEEGHESRRLTREQRLKEREVKRILHEEELARLQEIEERASSQDPTQDAEGSKRISERQTLTKKELHQKELERLAEEEGNWYFDCAKCGMHGENLDDGTHSIACDKCGVWQHSKCYGFSPKQAESDGFTFICRTCQRKEEDAKKPKIPPLKLHRNPASASPESHQPARPATAEAPYTKATKNNKLPPHLARQLDGDAGHSPQPHRPNEYGPFGNGSNVPQSQIPGQAAEYRYPPVANFASPTSQDRRPSTGFSNSPPPPRPIPTATNGHGAAGSPHQQQHQFIHHNAIASSGGHPGYQQPYSPHQNGHGQNAPSTGAQPLTHSARPYQAYPPSQQGQWNQQQPQSLPIPQPSRPHQPSQHGPARFNGFESSPVKERAQPVPPSSSQPNGPEHQEPSGAPVQSLASTHLPNLSASPRTNLPPPTASHYQQRNGPPGSPVKSSPPRPAQLASSHQLLGQQPQSRYLAESTSQHEHRPAQSPNVMQSTPRQPVSLPRPSSSNGFRPFQTPQMAPMSSAGSPGADIAADGMSGPWPEANKTIPQKKLDQSPAPLPPASSFTGQPVEMRSGLPEGLAPIKALAPSPRQPPTAERTIPVKKMVGPESSPAPVVLPPLHHSPIAPIEKLPPLHETKTSASEQRPSPTQ
ncbi:Cat eye syndrome critical region protein 2 [Acrodontium crateriforme]|uniref:Cat eye syndrome critical region protein 2 n=1 Tax=Acrodontium crateriforme TaxID=150365 RepID=A0AAQ3M1L7_9PEZI|nr:Cat eye syndrome critical region protein 2 [Acrodontium crateriforme]